MTDAHGDNLVWVAAAYDNLPVNLLLRYDLFR